ncbi:IclR family transcriptional regulator domain-containing protein [Phaeovulum sp. W22_SRMD_FR3]|uniref:IclR family transcriptional regulator domain-containing protein n=1 Tax=Phaeovulum sp. W22_SRMD_FR3 TaxID=3240274 RepID=UPI003F9B9A11
MSGKQERNPDFVEALARGLEVIQAFTEEMPEMTLSEIATQTGLSPATARRSLITLHELGYVAMNGKRFMLRAKILSLGAAFLNSMNLKDVADTYLEDVAKQFKDASSLAVMEGMDSLYVSHVAIERDIRFKARVGYRLPLYATSLGRVLLAWCAAPQRDAYLAKAPFVRYTPRTLVENVELLSELEKTRERGYATARDQLEYGVISIAVPVRAPDGQVVAAINCSNQVSSVDEADFVPSRLPVLSDAATRISAAMQQYPALLHSITNNR